MPRNCTVCSHPQREKIDALLIQGLTYREIAGQFSLSSSSLHRHTSVHISERLSKAKEAQEVAKADGLLNQVRSLQTKSLDILAKAEASDDFKTALGAIRESRGNLVLLAKLLGELKEGQSVNIILSPQWIELRTFILQALEPYPEARNAVSKTLGTLSNGRSNNT